MSRTGTILFFLTGVMLLMTVACQSMGDRDTIAKLRNEEVEIEAVKIEGGLDKAMASYQRFLEQTPDSKLAPDAIRRLADLKIEKEYGTLTDPVETSSVPKTALSASASKISAPTPAAGLKPEPIAISAARRNRPPVLASGESDAQFEQRAVLSGPILATDTPPLEPVEGVDDLERAGALEAIELYQRLLAEYPFYDRNDQVLYQMSRAYEELGRIPEAMTVMDRLVRQYPQSHYIDEVQFRRAEFFFAHHEFLDAEEAYSSIVNQGEGSSYYELALYKLGWTFYKQELYEDALHRFIALLDQKVSVGYDFEQTADETERKRSDDTFRVISLSFSNLGGADSVMAYFEDHGQRIYEDRIYSHLAEFYFDKRRYADASATYNAFVSRNPFHKKAPNFHMRVIDIHTAGGFPSLVLDAKKAFARNYGLKAEYWEHFQPQDRPDVLVHLKTNLKDLATHYHASYQDKRQVDDQAKNFSEALLWYREFLASFPQDDESPTINYHLADMLLENRAFGEAAVEYERTAYTYPHNDKSSAAGYAAVYAYREQLAATAEENQVAVKREVVRCSLKFADTFPNHEKAAIVLGAAADDLFLMKDYQQALDTATKLLATYPETDTDVTLAAHVVVGHASYELARYADAESAYAKVLDLMPESDKTRPEIVDNLAAAIYKQGEQANAAGDLRAAADHFLRVGRMAPTSKLRANAEYDGATALIQLKDWAAAAGVLIGFRSAFPDHSLQPEVTKKIAYVYREDGKLSLAAAEYERIEIETQDEAIRQEALLTAAELYSEDNNPNQALVVYRRYVDYFPQPVEAHLEARNSIADILKGQSDRDAYLTELELIVSIEVAAGQAQTPRTRYLASQASLVLGQEAYEAFTDVKLIKPFKQNLQIKQQRMKAATTAFDHLMTYEIGETTAAATFYLAEIYAHFCKALLTSQRPEGLSALELEQYELAIEEQAYPFEDQAIAVHQKNLEMIALGVYNDWIDKSLQKLAVFMPARYDKPEENISVIPSPATYAFVIEPPKPAEPAAVAQKRTTTAGEAREASLPEDAPALRPETQNAVPVTSTIEQSGDIPGTTADSEEQPPPLPPDHKSTPAFVTDAQPDTDPGATAASSEASTAGPQDRDTAPAFVTGAQPDTDPGTAAALSEASTAGPQDRDTAPETAVSAKSDAVQEETAASEESLPVRSQAPDGTQDNAADKQEVIAPGQALSGDDTGDTPGEDNKPQPGPNAVAAKQNTDNEGMVP